MLHYLIVDDDIIACERLLSLLKQSGLSQNQISFTCDLKVADSILEKVDTRNLILFLDVEMPYRNGFQFLEQARESGFQGKVIFVTAYNQYILKALRASAHDFLLKPVDTEELQQALVRINEKGHSSASQRTASLEHAGMSEREKEVIGLLVQGLSSYEIAEKLFLSKHTVDTHRRNILRKTDSKNTAHLIAKFSIS